MELIFIIILGFLVAFAPEIWEASKKLPRVGQKHALPAVSPTAGLSKPSKQLYREYMELPADSRPFPDIISVLRGLDAATAHDEQSRNDHYDDHYHMREAGYSSPTWQKMKFRWRPDYGPCGQKRGQTCEFHVYLDLHDEIANVKKELVATERAINQRSNAHHVDTARELVQRLRDEQSLQRDVRKELE